MSIRSQRIAEQIRAELASLLRDEISDPRIGMLTLNRVKVSPDLSSALVFWSPLDVAGETDIEEMQAGIESAAGFLRRQIAQRLALRRTPELHFRYDPSVEEGSRTLALLRSLPDVQSATDETPAAEDRGGEAARDERRSDPGE